MKRTILTAEDVASFSTSVCKACLRGLAKDWRNLPVSAVRNPLDRSADAIVIESQMSLVMDVLIERGINPDNVA